MNRLWLFPFVLLCLVVIPTPAYAWLRVPYEDSQVVERSELIVVGHLKDGSIQYVPHERKDNDGRSWEHHAILVITESLKGTSTAKEIPIIIHYGLDPVIGGVYLKNAPADAGAAAKGVIQIKDTGNSDHSALSPVADARDDNLWFLRKRSGIYGREPGNGDYGIVDPQDLRPMALKEYYLCYLAADSETAVKQYVAAHPDAPDAAKKYLEHQDIGHILSIADPKQRAEKLLPYYQRRFTWGMEPAAANGLIACGEDGAAALRSIFNDPKYANLRYDTIHLWGKMRYRGCVDLLIDLLKKHDQFWADQKLDPGWRNDKADSPLTRQRRNISGEIYIMVYALGQIGDARAREAIELTRKRWAAIEFDNTQIVEECDRALKAFDQKAP